MQIIPGGKMFCWKIVTNSYNYGWKSKHTQRYHKPLLSLGCLSLFLWHLHTQPWHLERRKWRRNMCRGFLCLAQWEFLFPPAPKSLLSLTIPCSLPPHPQFTLLSFPLALFPPYHVSSSESVDPQLFKKQLKLPTYKHRFLCLLNLF